MEKNLLILKTTFELKFYFKTAEKSKNDLFVIKPKPENKPRSVNQNYDGIRFRGIPESKAKDARDRAKAVLNAVYESLNHIQVSCQIQDLRRQEKYENKTRKVILRVNNPWDRRRIL